MMMKTLIVLAATVLAVDALVACPGGYEPVGNGCYLFPNSMLTWDESLSYCQSTSPAGATAGLAHLDDCSTLGAVWNYIVDNKDPDVDYWLGGRNTFSDGAFRWYATGDTIPKEVPFWYPGQPDGGVAEACLSLSKTGFLADEACGLPQRPVCQLL
ncbi:C-type lectin domain family 4 member D [Procambarus clarkii]|uniref:C-type lectin domain family 4 member D n=1 Tax=Procambarus clarkii TaxID=6728 RepID=UPI0037443FB1